MIYVDIQEKNFFNKIIYVFDFIFKKLGLKYAVLDKDCILKENDIVFTYSEKDTKNYFQQFNIIIKKSSKMFGNDYLKTDSIPNSVKKYFLKEFNIDNIVGIYNNHADDFYTLEGNNVIVNVDIISDIFFMLTRYEEVVNKSTGNDDIYERFSARQSLAYKNEFLHRPIVDEIVEFIWKIIDKFKLGYRRREFWNNKKFVVCLTHDVDSIKKYKDFNTAIRTTAKLIIRNKKVEKACSNFVNYFRGYKKDPHNTFDYIMNIENFYGFKSSFYFMTGGNSEHDNRYKINEPKVLELINKMECKGFEIGYHSSFNAYNNLDMIKQEKSILDKVVCNKMYGCRQHFLRFKVPNTWIYQEAAGILYDTTLSFADSEGFRCGTCFPYRPYDLLNDRVMQIWEIPLIVMDGSLQNKNYNSYDPEEAFEKTKMLINTVKKYGGVFTLLWHNSSLDRYDTNWDGWEKVYVNIMKYLYKSDCAGMTGREIINILQN